MKQCNCQTCRGGKKFHKIKMKGEREYTIVSTTHMRRMSKKDYTYIGKIG